MTTALTVERVACADGALLDALAALRIEVFRAYPYLYEGSLDYERSYLASYAQSSRSTLVVARDGDRVVGAATALPLAEHGEELVPAFLAQGLTPSAFYYFGESVLLPAYRGRGVGHAFFDHREASAREHGFTKCCFCAVERPANHPARPVDYTPLDAFWNKRGYHKHPELTVTFSWHDLGEARESEKRMVFWLKELS